MPRLARLLDQLLVDGRDSGLRAHAPVMKIVLPAADREGLLGFIAG